MWTLSWPTHERASRAHLPVDVAEAVVVIESGCDAKKIGAVGEIGLMQVRPATAAMLGFAGFLEELARPEINIRLGVTYLAEAWRIADGDLCRALMKCRAGNDQEMMTTRLIAYCARARGHPTTVSSSLLHDAVAPTSTVVVSRPLDRKVCLASVPKLNNRLRGAAFATYAIGYIHVDIAESLPSRRRGQYGGGQVALVFDHRPYEQVRPRASC